MKKILLTGFEPFGGETINPSLELIKRLQNDDWSTAEEGREFELHLLQLPVVFGKSVARLKTLINELNPDIVIGIGQAGSRTALSIERVAINVDDARIADNEGDQPIDRAINPAGPAAYFSTLPIKRMMKAAQDAGVPTIISNSAGTYVCNHLMYGILDILAGTEKIGGFIHIPFLPEQVVNKANYASMDLEVMLKGLKMIVKAAVTGEEDVKVVGGTLD